MRTNADDQTSLTERAYAAIRRMILTNELKPGANVDLGFLEQVTNTSRTPIRDALRWLADEGLVVVRPRSGTSVARPTPHDIEEVFGLRKAVELHAIQVSAQRIPEEVLHHLSSTLDESDRRLKHDDLQFFYDSDIEFHDTILRYADNRKLTQALQTASTWIAWFRVIGTKLGRPDRSIWYHRLILQALLGRNVIVARDLLDLHISEVERDMLHDFSSNAES